MVLFGIFNSRLGIGIEIFTNNLIYGPLSYLFIAFSGLMVIKFLQIINNPSEDRILTIKRAIILFVIFYLIGFVLIIVNVLENMIIYHLNFPILIFAAIFGILWCFFGYFGFNYRKNIVIISILIETFTFSIGLIYGAFLNTYMIPISLYFFFISITSLQLSRESLKTFNKWEKNQNFEHLISRLNNKKAFKISIVFQVLTLLFLVLPIFSNIINSALILILMILSLSIIGLASFLTLASIIEKESYKKIGSLLKIGIFLELLLLLVLGS